MSTRQKPTRARMPAPAKKREQADRAPRGEPPPLVAQKTDSGDLEQAPKPQPEKNAKSLAGRLIAFEGLEGSGISTQMRLMHKWLLGMGCRVFASTWESSELVRDASRRGRKQQLFTPMTYSLLRATDFADRYDRQILPMLKAGFIVLCERYYVTSLARDYVRGCDPEWTIALYSYAHEPDITFFMDLPLHLAIERKIESRQPIGYFEAGMDLGLSQDIQESYRVFQGRITEQYTQMIEQYGFLVVDAVVDIHSQQAILRKHVAERIRLAEFSEGKKP